jgi:hypothetical protein
MDCQLVLDSEFVVSGWSEAVEKIKSKSENLSLAGSQTA